MPAHSAKLKPVYIDPCPRCPHYKPAYKFNATAARTQRKTELRLILTLQAIQILLLIITNLRR